MKTQNKQKRNVIRDVSTMSQVFYAWDVQRPFATGFSCRFPHEYVPVAVVDCDSLDEIFNLMNFSEEFFDFPMRGQLGLSTRCLSAGDVVMLPDGRTWICALNGWEPIMHGEMHFFEGCPPAAFELFGKPDWEV